nr:MAG TPA: hypothetical protein [Caudoviricetes sp.]
MKHYYAWCGLTAYPGSMAGFAHTFFLVSSFLIICTAQSLLHARVHLSGGVVLKWSVEKRCARAYLQHLKTIILWRRTL